MIKFVIYSNRVKVFDYGRVMTVNAEKEPTVEELKTIIEFQEKEIEHYQKRIARLKERINMLQEGHKHEAEIKKKGRPSISDQMKFRILQLRNDGLTMRQISEKVGVSLGGVSKVIKSFEQAYDYKLYLMDDDKLCTEIFVNEKCRKIKIINHTDNLLWRAFGCLEEPTWEDYEYFLESRCFPRTRDRQKYILRDLGLVYYDPLSIIKVTQGRMAEDHQWIRLEMGGDLK